MKPKSEPSSASLPEYYFDSPTSSNTNAITSTEPTSSTGTTRSSSLVPPQDTALTLNLFSLLLLGTMVQQVHTSSSNSPSNVISSSEEPEDDTASIEEVPHIHSVNGNIQSDCQQHQPEQRRFVIPPMPTAAFLSSGGEDPEEKDDRCQLGKVHSSSTEEQENYSINPPQPVLGIQPFPFPPGRNHSLENDNDDETEPSTAFFLGEIDQGGHLTTIASGDSSAASSCSSTSPLCPSQEIPVVTSRYNGHAAATGNDICNSIITSCSTLQPPLPDKANTVDSPTSVVTAGTTTTETPLSHIPEDFRPAAKQESSWWQDTTHVAGRQVDAVIQHAEALWDLVQVQVEQTQNKFSWDRPFVMTCLLASVATILSLGVLAILGFGGIVLVTSPFWLPIAILFSPLWIPVALLSSPVWVTLGVVAALATVSTVSVTTIVVLFFAWPEEWLPAGKSAQSSYHPAVSSFLRTRRTVEGYVKKVQVKILLYAAGVGPAADLVFGIADRIDLGVVRDRLAKVDVQRLQRCDVSELQALVFEAVRAMML